MAMTRCDWLKIPASTPQGMTLKRRHLRWLRTEGLNVGREQNPTRLSGCTISQVRPVRGLSKLTQRQLRYQETSPDLVFLEF